MTEMVATPSIERRCRHCPCRRDVRAAWAAASPTIDDCGTRRDSGPGRGSDAASQAVCPRNAVQNEGRGVSRASEGPTAPDVPGGELGSPNGLISRWQHDIDSDRNSGAARSLVTRWWWCVRDKRLLESRSPRRVASADRRWRWPEGCLSREPVVHTAVADGQITQFRTEAKGPKVTNEVRREELSPEKGEGASRRGRKRTR